MIFILNNAFLHGTERPRTEALWLGNGPGEAACLGLWELASHLCLTALHATKHLWGGVVSVSPRQKALCLRSAGVNGTLTQISGFVTPGLYFMVCSYQVGIYIFFFNIYHHSFHGWAVDLHVWYIPSNLQILTVSFGWWNVIGRKSVLRRRKMEKIF